MSGPRFECFQGECIDVMKAMPAESVDAIVTDPPYGIGFMGKEWDSFSPDEARHRVARNCRKHTPIPSGFLQNSGACSPANIKYDRSLSGNRKFQEWCEQWSAEALRVLKPGGYMLVFSGARTYHRMATGVEDAGFEVRDQLMWLFGSGFPKSHNMKGEHEGWGTALKSAHEPILMARKPFGGTVADNVARFGVGAIHVDACRVATSDGLGGGRLSGPTSMADTCGGPEWDRPWMNDPSRREGYAEKTAEKVERAEYLGRWPANVLHDGSDEVLAAFPDAPGQIAAVRGDEPSSKTNNVYGKFDGRPATTPRDDLDTSAARFFYCAKASRSERDAGLSASDTKLFGMSEGARRALAQGAEIYQGEGGMGLNRIKSVRNHHPTVKPIDLMRYLCRLVTPRGGVVLDPFMGSGTTGCAAMLEEFNFIGIEKEAEFIDLARRRIAYWHTQRHTQVAMAI